MLAFFTRLLFNGPRRPQAQTKRMTTVTDYRKLAEECFEWAREARDVSVREHYASLGRIWLECAERAKLRSGAVTLLEPKTDLKVA